MTLHWEGRHLWSPKSRLQPIPHSRNTLKLSGNDAMGVIEFFVSARLLPLRQNDFLPRQVFVIHLVEQMPDNIQACSSLIVRGDYIPGSPLRVGFREHSIASTRVVIPAAVRSQVH